MKGRKKMPKMMKKGGPSKKKTKKSPKMMKRGGRAK
tara:strand:+ start:131 stop:238 length:108 start_codon:yes stop_codon:yes gene_type:complete